MEKKIICIGLLLLTPLLVYAATYNGTATGPELDYVHGVTSGIQAQINAKVNASTFGSYSGNHARLGANTYTGTQTAPAFVSNAADGTHYVQPYNSVAFSGTPAEGMLQTNSSGIGLYTSAAWTYAVLTSSLGSGVQTALGNAVNGTGGLVTYGQPLPDGVTATTQAAHSNDTKVATDAYVDTATPFFYSGTSITITRENAYAVCTGDCAVTPPAPAAGKQFCVRNAPGGSHTITLAALGSGNYYEKPDHSGYGTANATFTATAATTNQACFVGLDANHYLLMGAVGTWTAN